MLAVGPMAALKVYRDEVDTRGRANPVPGEIRLIGTMEYAVHRAVADGGGTRLRRSPSSDRDSYVLVHRAMPCPQSFFFQRA
jgi:hypothetical protein